MADADVADRLAAAAHGADEVAHVVLGYFEPRRALRQRFVEQALVTGGDQAAIDEDPLVVFALEEHAIVDPALAALAFAQVASDPAVGRPAPTDEPGALAALRPVAVGVDGL